MTTIEIFKRELVIRKYTISTVQTYESCLKVIFENIGEHPSLDQIKNYLATIKGYSYHKQLVGTIHNYFEFVLKQPLNLSDIPYPRKVYKLPEILSIEEIQAIFDKCQNLKHRTILSLLYGSGLRMGEVLNLKLSDIDSSRMVFNIREGKGLKDRQMPLSQQLSDLINNYISQYNPKEYLFNGQFGLQYTNSSVNSLLKYYADKAGVKKRIHAHKIRHCYATHLLEAGTEMSLIQKLLGHKKIQTTQIYSHISKSLLSKVNSPLTNINL
jgi:site-specific recombinase XerD